MTLTVMQAYQANNIRGQWKRAFCSATLTGFGGIGGIAGSLVFRSQDAPSYTPGFIAVIVYAYHSLFNLCLGTLLTTTNSANCMVAVIALMLTVLFKRRNKLADEGNLIINDNPEFRYTL